jgi:hypothetical protein
MVMFMQTKSLFTYSNQPPNVIAYLKVWLMHFTLDEREVRIESILTCFLLMKLSKDICSAFHNFERFKDF